MAEFVEICEKAVRRGGQILLELLGRAQVREKGRADLVTEADVASQEAIRKIILDAFPDHVLVGEEDQPGGPRPVSPTGHRWIVDPLDGTTNYVHQVPHFSISLALERRGELLVGAVFDPTSEECFLAVRGRGATLNGTRLHASQARGLSEALVAIGFPAVTTPQTPDLILFCEAVQVCQSMRRTGSAALNLAYVAAGRFDAAWACVSKNWDFAAGALLVHEAGGTVTRLDGSPLTLDHGPFLAAANSAIHGELLGMIARTGITLPR